MDRSSLRAIAAGAAGLVVSTAAAVGLSYAVARGVPLSPTRGDYPFDPFDSDQADRQRLYGGAVTDAVASLAAYTRPGFDPDGVHPAVRELYERPAAFSTTSEVTWHHPFRLGARGATRLTGRSEQARSPGPDGTREQLDGTLADLTSIHASRRRDDEASSTGPDDRARAHSVASEGRITVSTPHAGVSLATVLEVAHLGDGLELTTDCPTGGLYLSTDAGAFRLPASQRIRVMPARDSAAPAPPDGTDRYDANVLCDQRIRLFGLPLVTVRYAARTA